MKFCFAHSLYNLPLSVLFSIIFLMNLRFSKFLVVYSLLSLKDFACKCHPFFLYFILNTIWLIWYCYLIWQEDKVQFSKSISGRSILQSFNYLSFLCYLYFITKLLPSPYLNQIFSIGCITTVPLNSGNRITLLLDLYFSSEFVWNCTPDF